MNEQINTWQNKTIFIAAGGTGGHLFPALAVAEKLRKMGANIHWLGNLNGFEGTKIPDKGFIFHDLKVKPLRGKNIFAKISAIFALFLAILRTCQLIFKFKPCFLFATGGYVSGAACIGSKICRLAFAIHEQNAVFGMTNRRLAKFANITFIAYDDAAKYVSNLKNIELVGNPVREEIAQITDPKIRLENSDPNLRILVLGGSQGAQAINEIVPETIAKIKNNLQIKILHQCGKGKKALVDELYEKYNIDADVCEFIDDMTQAYANCDLIISRSGASTVAEIATVGVAAIFIPFPFAVDNHQTANAKALPGSIIIEQKDLTAELLAEKIISFDKKRLLETACLIREKSSANAVDNIIISLEKLINAQKT